MPQCPNHSMIRILAIESSCDDTGASVCCDGEILSNIVATQKIHEQYGGVVPELASRAHIQHIVPVVDAALKKANVTLNDIDAFAFTQSPGLIGSLLVGVQFAKSMALAFGKPLIAVHHMQAHVLANLISKPSPSFPFLCLTVSGGHTQIILCKSPYDLTVIGETIDDAAGEAFDKTAKMLGLPYPGGPHLARLAETGRPGKFDFPRPMLDRPGFDFSFSGLKTAVVVAVRSLVARTGTLDEQTRADVARAFQDAVVETLVAKCDRALKHTQAQTLVVAGGVGANLQLREQLLKLGERRRVKVSYPRPEFCTDNAAMIAYAGYLRLYAGQQENLSICAHARWPIDQLLPPGP